MDTQGLQQVLTSGAAPIEKVRAAYDLGRAGPAAAEALPLLMGVAARREEDILVRGYAAWAAEEIAPRPADEPGRTYHVAQRHKHANDLNDGSAERPWMTVQRAAEVLRPGDTVVIYGGLYRECVRPFMGGTGPERMITYRAAPGQKPVITAAEPWKVQWRSEGGDLWWAPYERHPWDRPERWPNPAAGAVRRAEQIIVEHMSFTHVDTRKELLEGSQRFLTDDEAGRLWLRLGGPVPPAGRGVERVMRQQVFAPAVRGLGHISVQGLTMQFGAAPEVSGSNWDAISHRAVMSVRSGRHWTIEDCTIEWGNAQGLDIGAEGWGEDIKGQPVVCDEPGGHVVRRCRVNQHGLAGIVGWGKGQKGLLLEDNETNHNCRKGNWRTWEGAGLKIHGATDCVIRRHRACDNRAYGIWLDHRCERNRITQCICLDNAIEGIFFEVSPGPVLIDNNVVIDSRDEPEGGGLYSHDGNSAAYVNNYVSGTKFGARLRNLFGRIDGGRPTATSHNRIYNNFIINPTVAAVSLNPEVPQAEDNRSDSNILWQRGRRVTMQLENTGAGVQWEKTLIGRALGLAGGGTAAVPLALWQAVLGEDRGSLVVPPAILFDTRRPERIREALVKVWPADAPALDGGWGEVWPRAAADLAGALRPELAGGRCVRTLWLAPDAGLQVWQTPRGPLAVRWQGGDKAEIQPLAETALLADPEPSCADVPVLAVGHTLRLPAAEGARVAASGLDAGARGGELVVSAATAVEPGDYGVVLIYGNVWRYVAVRVSPAFVMGGIGFTREGGSAVTAALSNHGQIGGEAAVRLQLGGREVRQVVAIQPGKTVEARLPVEFDGAGEAVVTAEVGGATLAGKSLVSFARAARSASWADAPRYPIENFPGGAFPEGIEAFTLYRGGLAARWAARHDGAGLHLLVEVEDEKHEQTQKIDKLQEADSIQVQAKAVPGLKPLEIVLAMNSETGETIVVRRQAPDPEKFSAGRAADVPARIARSGRLTTYEVTLPWPMLGLAAPPRLGQGVRLSILVNNNDGRGRHGLQWFFGIRDHEGDERMMGTVWLD